MGVGDVCGDFFWGVGRIFYVFYRETWFFGLASNINGQLVWLKQTKELSRQEVARENGVILLKFLVKVGNPELCLFIPLLKAIEEKWSLTIGMRSKFIINLYNLCEYISLK